MATTLGGAMFGPQLAHHLPDLSERPEYQLSWSKISVTPLQRWVPQHLCEQVRTLSQLPAEVSVLDESLVHQLAAAFSQHPWVESVRSVQKQPQGIHVELVYREPALMVQTRRGAYPVDTHGVLLPPSDFSLDDVEMFPTLEKVRSTPQGPAGTPWGDRAVVGAAQLAVQLTSGEDHQTPWERYGLRAIVVRSQPGPVADVEDIEFGLTTTSGSYIVWGHAPGSDALEPNVAQKFERIDKFLADNGRFEQLNQPVFLDITDWEVIRWDLLSKVVHESVIR